MNAEAENCQARRWNAQMSRSEGWAAWLVRIVTRGQSHFRPTKIGTIPGTRLGAVPEAKGRADPGER